MRVSSEVNVCIRWASGWIGMNQYRLVGGYGG